MAVEIEGMRVEEVARVFGICRSGAYKAVGDGVIPSVRIGRRLVVPRRWVEATLDGSNARSSEGAVATTKRGAVGR